MNVVLMRMNGKAKPLLEDGRKLERHAADARQGSDGREVLGAGQTLTFRPVRGSAERIRRIYHREK